MVIVVVSVVTCVGVVGCGVDAAAVVVVFSGVVGSGAVVVVVTVAVVSGMVDVAVVKVLIAGENKKKFQLCILDW